MISERNGALLESKLAGEIEVLGENLPQYFVIKKSHTK
jgi:hypothetical protein